MAYRSCPNPTMVVANTLWLQTSDVLKTYLECLDVNLLSAPFDSETGQLDLTQLEVLFTEEKPGVFSMRQMLTFRYSAIGRRAALSVIRYTTERTKRLSVETLFNWIGGSDADYQTPSLGWGHQAIILRSTGRASCA